MRFQSKYLFSVFCLVLTSFMFIVSTGVSHAQLPACSCDNSSTSTCADGYRVTFLGQNVNTFKYSVCNESDNPISDCQPTMDLSHADIIIANPSCISNPATDITTMIIGTDGFSTRACDAPTNKDKSCGVDNLTELLIKCDETDGIYEPGPGECVEIDIQIDNTPGIMIGPSISLNKAGQTCGSGCLLGPSCEGCTPPPTDPPPTNPPPTDAPPTDAPPTDPPPTNPPPTDPPPTNPPPTDPPPTNPPPTDPPPTNPPPTDAPDEGCCVESQGVCSIETSAACQVPPNLEFLGLGSSCTNQPLCVPPPTNPPPTEPPPTVTPEMGCCVEAQGLCDIALESACSTPPNLDFMGRGTNCDNVSACNIPPPVAQVPTMSEWGLIATAVMLGLFSLITVKRGFRINNK